MSEVDAQTQRRKDQGVAFNQAVEQGLAEESLGRKTLEARAATEPARRIISSTTSDHTAAPPSSKPKSWKAYYATIKPAVDSFMLQAERILRDWSKDPVVMCCLIRNLAAIGGLDKIQKFTRNPKVQEARGILHQMRSMLDLVIGFLQKDIDTQLKRSVDLLGSIMLAVIGAVITTLDLLQQYLREEIFQLMGKQRDSVFRRCWPFDALIDFIIKTISHPVTGIFVKLDQYILDWQNKVKEDIGMKYNCSSLDKADEELKALTARREEVEAEIEENINVDGQALATTSLKTKAKNINKAINVVRSRISINKGIPIVGQAGCYLRKVETLQNLKYFRNTIDKVIAGLDKGILCVNLTDEQLANSPNPLNDVSSVNHPAQRSGISVVFPTDDEVGNFLVDEFGLDGDEVAEIVANIEPDNINDEESIEKDLDGQIRAVETLADCTQVISDELIVEINSTISRLEG
jgi:CHASE3 domain sensor protein